jgi:virginiamycin B lyase
MNGKFRLWAAGVVVVVATIAALAPAAGAVAPPKQEMTPSGLQAARFDGLSASPVDIAGGPDGTVWMLETSNGKVAKTTLDTPVVEYQGPASAVEGSGRHLVAGPDGAMWYITTAAAVERVTTSGQFTAFAAPNGFVPKVMTLGPDGIFYVAGNTPASGDRIMRLTTAGVWTDFVAAQPLPTDITVGPDGNLWYSAVQRVVRVKLNGTVTVFTAPSLCCNGITSGPDGRLWTVGSFSMFRVTTGGSFTPVDVPEINNGDQMVSGPDNAVWTTDTAGHVFRVLPNGYWIRFTLTNGRRPNGIAVGTDGNVWAIANADPRLFYFDTNDLTRFIKNDYLDVLGRPADPDAIAWYVGQFFLIDGLTDTGQLTQILLASQEWRDHEITSIFTTYLHRAPDPGGLAYWSGKLAQGYRIEDLESLIIGSDEYFFVRGGGNVTTYIQTVYQDLLHRSAEPGGLTYWTNLLNHGTPRGAVANALVYSNEAFHLLVRDLYQHYLGRLPDPGGEIYWADQLAHGFTDQQLIIGLTGSEEYFFKPAPA